ncbi:MAG: FAD-binding oxidoreductase [Hyphomicrobiales bacterium]|nr:MAG: FAD-binding oxidoreductase [Hyphomicrobiales bacterium]
MNSLTRMRPQQAEIEAAIDELRALLDERLSVNGSVREQHGQDLTWHKGAPPDAVAFARSTEEVAKIVTICAKHKVPVIAFGTGTSLEGHISAVYGGVSIDMSGMNRIVSVHAEDLDCVVEAGVTRLQLNDFLRDTGLFFPIDPGADASLGGMAATRASGTNAVRYGTMRDNVLALTAVMADGTVVKSGGRARKSAAGYDLTRLLVGSEGTLGIITEVTLRLQGIPEAISAGICPFESVDGACDAVILTIQSGIPVARIELLDKLQVQAVNAYSKLDLPEQPTLFLEFHGSDMSVKEQAERFAEIAAECGGGSFDWATRTEDRNRLWTARHNAYYAALALAPGKKGLSTDVCVPISRLADCVRQTREDIEQSGFLAPIVGHVGDGNFHVLLLIDMDDPQDVARGKAFLDRLAARAIAMEGTCTGEHGVGMGKMKYMQAEHGTGLTVMRAVKLALDPDNLMNPGKIIPEGG